MTAKRVKRRRRRDRRELSTFLEKMHQPGGRNIFAGVRQPPDPKQRLALARRATHWAENVKNRFQSRTCVALRAKRQLSQTLQEFDLPGN